MKRDKKTKYFFSVTEFKDINKNPFIAGLLSIFLGMFGAHRFYLKRKISGGVFFILTILSVVYDRATIAAILMLITFTEGAVYIIKGVGWLKDKYFNNNIIENEDIGNVKGTIYGEKSRMDENQTLTTIVNDKINLHSIDVIDVSEFNPVKIPKKNEFSNVYQNDWVDKLDIPNEMEASLQGQVKEETLKIYVKLCDFIDDELRKNRSSLNKVAKKIDAQGGYYNNILYLIYCISKGHTAKGYTGSYDNYDPANFYRILEVHLGKNIKDKIFSKAQELEKYVSPPQKETLFYFNLTESGLSRKWWDFDGKLRDKRKFLEKELNILKSTPFRSTVIWEVRGIKEQIIYLYLEIWKIISDGLAQDFKWSKKKKNILINIMEGKYYADYDNGNILASLLKISENTIRQVVPNTQVLNTVKEQENITRYFPKEVANSINNKIGEYIEKIDNKILETILQEMIENNPGDWKLKVEKILKTGTDLRAKELIKYEKDENFMKITKEIAKRSEDEDLTLLSLYAIERQEKLSQKNASILKGIIYQDNQSLYENLVKNKESLTLELFNKLLELKNPIRKKIELDMDKVQVSKKELSETVNILKEYIGEDDKEVVKKECLKEEVIEKKDTKAVFKYGEFLGLILEKGSVGIEHGKKIAMDNGTLLNAFISDVNKELYEYIQDQTVIIEDDYIKIDDFYIDMVKELMTNAV